MVYPNRLWIILKIWLEEHIANLLGEGVGGSDDGLYHELGEDRNIFAVGLWFELRIEILYFFFKFMLYS